MDGPDSPTPSRSPTAPVTRVFEATRLADEFLAAAYDQILATAEPAPTPKPVPRSKSRRVPTTAPTTTGGRSR